MAKEVFIPNWYIDRKSEAKGKKIKVILSILTLLNILIGIYVLNLFTKVEGISKDEYAKKNYQINNIGNDEPVKQRMIVIKKYKEVTEYFEENHLNYNNLFMSKSNFEINMQVKNYEEYINAIKCIEKKYSIKNLTVLSKDKKEYIFKVMF